MGNAKALADISMELWLRFRAAGFKTKVVCSKRSLSRYVECEGNFRIRVSDHVATDGNTSWDYQVVVLRSDDPKQKMIEAIELFVRLAGASANAAA